MGDAADDAIGQGMDGFFQAMESDDEGRIEDEMAAGAYRPRRPRASGPGRCPRCGSKTALRVGPLGEFYGCRRYPRCHGSRDAGAPPFEPFNWSKGGQDE